LLIFPSFDAAKAVGSMGISWACVVVIWACGSIFWYGLERLVKVQYYLHKL